MYFSLGGKMFSPPQAFITGSIVFAVLFVMTVIFIEVIIKYFDAEILIDLVNSLSKKANVKHSLIHAFMELYVTPVFICFLVYYYFCPINSNSMILTFNHYKFNMDMEAVFNAFIGYWFWKIIFFNIRFSFK